MMIDTFPEVNSKKNSSHAVNFNCFLKTFSFFTAVASKILVKCASILVYKNFTEVVFRHSIKIDFTRN